MKIKIFWGIFFLFALTSSVSASAPPQAFGCNISGVIMNVTFVNESSCFDFNKWIGNDSINCSKIDCCPEDVLSYTPAHYLILVKVQSIETIEDPYLSEQERPGNHIARCEEIRKVGEEIVLEISNVTDEPKKGSYVQGILSNSYVGQLKSYTISEIPPKESTNFFQRILNWFKNLF